MTPMHFEPGGSHRLDGDSYLHGRGAAWFAFAMTIGLMVFDYIDRQVIVSIFPHLRAEWGLSDKQLGALASIVSVTVAIGGIPVALVADRISRAKSIAFMAITWSLATISCMFVRSYAPLLAARGVVGLGEAGYGSVGAVLLASHFPLRMRSTLMAAFFAAASLGSVLGVLLGGLIAAKWGWQAVFGVVGVPGLALALLYFFVRDYCTVALPPALDAASQTSRGVIRRIVQVLSGSRTIGWLCVGGPAQLIVVSAVWAWLPSFLNRVYGLDPAAAATKSAGVVLVGAVGSIVFGLLVDRLGRRHPELRLPAVATGCVGSFVVFAAAFGGSALGFVLPPHLQLWLIVFGGFLMTCSAGPIAAIVIEVMHPGVRSTGCSVLSLVQNLLGLALGPFITGVLSDLFGIGMALALVPAFSLLAAVAFLLAARSYVAERRQVNPIAQPAWT